jgi:hypothetical protein
LPLSLPLNDDAEHLRPDRNMATNNEIDANARTSTATTRTMALP